jgi:hypothetical protein
MTLRRSSLAALLALGFAGCSLNPQPLPPDQPGDGGALTSSAAAQDASAGTRMDAGKGTLGTGSGSGTAPQNIDASLMPDSGETASCDGGQFRADAATDASSDGGAPDGAVVDAPTEDTACEAERARDSHE